MAIGIFLTGLVWSSGALLAQQSDELERWNSLMEGSRSGASSASGIPTSDEIKQVARDLEEAVEIARSPGFPQLLLADSLELQASWAGGQTKILLLEEAISIRSKELGSDDPAVADLLVHLAGMNDDSWRDARAVLERALRIYESSLGGDSPKVANTLILLGIVDLNDGNELEAEQRFREALVLCPARPDDPEGIGLNAQAQLLELLERQGRLEELEVLRREFSAVSDAAQEMEREVANGERFEKPVAGGNP
ncbi:MAG: tetratricopeptide repeat protein [Thermoanaerobaculia bacterium]|nr:tetratricopeptide repeat protein [Thermoanaerobaculia bacterium]